MDAWSESSNGFEGGNVGFGGKGCANFRERGEMRVRFAAAERCSDDDEEECDISPIDMVGESGEDGRMTGWCGCVDARGLFDSGEGDCFLGWCG